MQKIILIAALIMPLLLYPSLADAATDYTEAERLISAGELDKAHAILDRGKFYYSKQKFDEAVSEFDRYMERMRPLATTDATRAVYINDLHDISQICFGLKRYVAGRKFLDEILKLLPEDQTATYNLGIYYYKYERSRSMAYKFFSKAVQIDPASGTAAKAKYAIEFIRANPDPRIEPEFSFIDKEFRD